MSYRPRVKTDTSGNKIDFPLDAETVKGEDVVNTKQDKLVSGTNIKTLNGLSLLGSGDISTSSITEIPTQYIRITDLESGVYKLTYSGTKYLYYKGPVSTSTHTISATSHTGPVILTVSKFDDLHWQWNYIAGGMSTTLPTIYYGYSYSDSEKASGNGSVGSKSLNRLLTSHQTMYYRPIQVNGTQILANSSSTALNLSNDGNVKFAQVSGGKIKVDISGLEVAKLYDFTVYNDTYTWGHLTSGNGYTQLFSLDTAAGASIGLAEKDGKLSMQIDGDYYGNEGIDRLSYCYETPLTCTSSSGETPEDISYNDTFFRETPYIGTVLSLEHGWQNIINIRHRGGHGGDGIYYGMQLRTALTSSDSLWYRQQTSPDYWTDWKKIQNDLELTYYGSSTNDQLKMWTNGSRFYVYIVAPSDSVQSLSQINANGTATTTHTVRGGGLVIVKRDTDNFVQVSINTTGTHADYTDTTDSAYTRITTSNIMVDCWRH